MAYSLQRFRLMKLHSLASSRSIHWTMVAQNVEQR